MTDADKAILYTLDLVDRAGDGDQGAQSILQKSFHEANQKTLQDISDKAGDVSLVFLAIGCPEAAGAFGAISMTADGLIAVDHLVNGEIKEGISDALLIAASFSVSKGIEHAAAKIAKIQICVGKNGRYYEIGKRGAIKTEAALRKQIEKDIASGYFGKNIVPELASEIIEEAAKAFRKVKGTYDE